jgi:Domain of unknown function (DUF4406)
MIDKKYSVYVSGPMSSVGGNYNIPLFDHVTIRLRSTGRCYVLNPAEYAIQCIGSLEKLMALGKIEMARRRREFLKYEINWIMNEADYVLMLPGWERSTGATAERAVALAFDIPVREVPTVFLHDGPIAQWQIEDLGSPMMD